MTPDRPERKAVQLSLFEQRTVSVSWIATRWKASKDTVLRLLDEGQLRGYRLTLVGWWRVYENSVLEYEQKLHRLYGPDGTEGVKKP